MRVFTVDSCLDQQVAIRNEVREGESYRCQGDSDLDSPLYILSAIFLGFR
jgi:hypothetical protein